MILQFPKGLIELDKSEEINMTADSFRFSGIRDNYTTDFTIPATVDNLKILGCYGLLDRDQYVADDALLIFNGEYIDVSVEVTSVNEKEIGLCCYEKNWNSEISDIKINDFLTDSNSTILEWNENSVTKYPANFLRYSYGMALNTNFAQYHPVIKLNDITGRVNLGIPIGLSIIDADMYTIATKKIVCPQNKIQVFEANLDDMTDSTFKLRGGQHVSNDLCWNMTDSITFDRYVEFKMDFFIVWQKRNIVTTDAHVIINKNNNFYRHITLESSSEYAQYVHITSSNMFAHSADLLSVTLDNPNKFKNVTIVCKITYTNNYNIYQRDYDKELEYVYRRPRLHERDSGFVPFDGDTHIFHDEGAQVATIPTQSLSFSYFGLLTNIPEISIKEYVTALAWYSDKKLKLESNYLAVRSPYKTIKISGYIEDKCPISENIGQKNYVKFTNYLQPLFQINNKFLANTKNIVELNVYDPTPLSQWTLEIDQYNNPSVDEDAGRYNCDFEDVGFVIGRTLNNQSLSRISLDDKLGFYQISKCLLCTIITKDNVTDADYVVLDGRKYMIISVDHDLETNLNTLKTLLV